MFGIELQGMQRLISSIGSAIVELLRLLCFCVVLGNPYRFSRQNASTHRFYRSAHILGYITPTAERDVRAYDFLKYSVAFLDDGTLAVFAQDVPQATSTSGASRRDSSWAGVISYGVLSGCPTRGYD
jgi:hypothetical protein